jgi:hypothetical protein
MKDNILNVNLETQTAPQVRETIGKDWIEYGTEDNVNLYPQFLIDLFYNSSTHAAIVNATSAMIAGDDIICEDDENSETYIKTKQFFANVNGTETMHELLKKVAFDFKLQGAFALNIVWSADRTEIAELYHVPVERLRAAKPNAMGVVTEYFISANWADTRRSEPQAVPAFNPNDRTSPSQILYTGRYSPEMDVYHVPDYVGGCNWALIDQHIAEFHLNNIQNGFAGSYFISFVNGIPTQEERFAIEKSLQKKFTGTNASGRFVLTFSEDSSRVPQITPISVSNADKQYLALQELMTQNILVSHRVTSPMLMGIKNDTGLGSNADELNSAFEVYLNTVVKPYQTTILNCLHKILMVNGLDVDLSFVQSKPVTTRFTIDDMRAVMTQEEIREELGLAPLIKEEQVDEEIEYNSQNLTQHTVLEKFIADFGEEQDTEWELVDEEIVDGEHNDFDYETEINNIANEKINLAEAIIAKPNIISKDRSERDEENTVIDQDNVSKDYNNYYKVRYVYATDNFLTNKSGTSRMFCKKMVAADKVYRKRDILNANSLKVNNGFGPYGRERYNLFLYKGGAQCRHFWLRRIYKTSLRNAKSKISDSQIITATKARSEGFTIKKNDRLVAIPPQKMKNNGYINKR